MVASRFIRSIGTAALMPVLFATLLAGSALAAGNEVVCKEEGSKRAYRLQFDWASQKVTIAARYGNGQWKTTYKNATAVRNGANDPSFLAEGVPEQYVGGGTSGCGNFIETWSFDVAKAGNALQGTLERTPKWVASQASCKAKVPAPELQTATVRLTCT